MTNPNNETLVNKYNAAQSIDERLQILLGSVPADVASKLSEKSLEAIDGAMALFLAEGTRRNKIADLLFQCINCAHIDGDYLPSVALSLAAHNGDSGRNIDQFLFFFSPVNRAKGIWSISEKERNKDWGSKDCALNDVTYKLFLDSYKVWHNFSLSAAKEARKKAKQADRDEKLKAQGLEDFIDDGTSATKADGDMTAADRHAQKLLQAEKIVSKKMEAMLKGTLKAFMQADDKSCTDTRLQISKAEMLEILKRNLEAELGKLHGEESKKGSYQFFKGDSKNGSSIAAHESIIETTALLN